MKNKKIFKLKNNKNSLKNWDKVYSEASELSRWICLYEAVNMIADKAEEKKLSFNDIDIKPLAIYKYMESMEDIILKQTLEQLYNIKIHYSEISDTKELSYQ
jgi:hypothetical protein